jgi:selenocysteine lyase/cysteine desulfurase
MLGVWLPESVRTGIVAALAEANCFASVRGESLRIAPHPHNTDADVERLVTALAAATPR